MEQTLALAQAFPDGTEVSLYDAKGWAGFPSSGGPPGAALQTKTAEGGSVTFTELETNHPYFVAALINGAWRYISFIHGAENPPDWYGSGATKAEVAAEEAARETRDDELATSIAALASSADLADTLSGAAEVSEIATVAEWNFDGDVTDSVGPNDGEAVGAPSYGEPLADAERTGKAIVLNGVNQAISVPDHPSLRLRGSLWLTIYAERGSTTGLQELLRKGSSYRLFMDEGGGGLGFEMADGAGGNVSVSAATDILKGRRYRIDVVYNADAETISIYVSGRLVKVAAATSGPNPANTSALNIGARVSNNDRWWKGRLDKVRIRNAAGTAAEVLAEYRAESRVILSEGFETGDLSLWIEEQESGGTLSIIGAEPTPFEGSKALKAAVEGGETRAEVVRGDTHVSDGDDIYFRWRTYFENAPVADWGFLFWQLRDEGDDSPVLGMYVRGDGNLKLMGGPATGLPMVTYWEGPPPELGRWHDFIVRVVCSEESTLGRVELWHDGVKQALAVERGRTAFGLAYPKWGLYRSDQIESEGIVYHDGIEVVRQGRR